MLLSYHNRSNYLDNFYNRDDSYDFYHVTFKYLYDTFRNAHLTTNLSM